MVEVKIGDYVVVSNVCRYSSNIFTLGDIFKITRIDHTYFYASVIRQNKKIKANHISQRLARLDKKDKDLYRFDVIKGEALDLLYAN